MINNKTMGHSGSTNNLIENFERNIEIKQAVSEINVVANRFDQEGLLFCGQSIDCWWWLLLMMDHENGAEFDKQHMEGDAWRKMEEH